jgi:predicted DNA-binding transcriptional regulator YafY
MDMKTKNALPRIYMIDQKIASGNYPNTKELAGEYEVSVSTISRDIEFMRDFLYAPIEYDALNRGYYYSEKTYRVPGSFTSAEDMQAIGIVKNLLSLYKDTPIFKAARQLLESITAPLSDRDNPGWFEDRIVVPPAASAVVDSAVWNTITEGLRKNRVISFNYQSVWDEVFKSRKVRPYQLLFDAGVWLLYGYSEERKAIRVFSLSRIKNIKITEMSFTLPKDFSYLAQASGSYFGVFSGGKKERYRIVFYDDSVAWVKERRWADDQKIADSGGSAVISFTSTQYYKVLEWVLSRGCMAKPLEPGQLVKDWHWHIREMRKNK